jgi:hypothetical protein
MDHFLKRVRFDFLRLAKSFDKGQILLFVERAIEIIGTTSIVSGRSINQIVIDRVSFDNRCDGIVEIEMLPAGQCGDFRSERTGCQGPAGDDDQPVLGDFGDLGCSSIARVR